ncbi:MAG: SHOCT domain-containing protein [Dehalococcoidia bacterium]
MWTDYGMHMGSMWLWSVIGLAVVVVLVWAMVRAGGAAARPHADESPEAILKRRYARGEIEREEYERALTDLRR